ncbi:T9SS type A sorting domain-containing protein [Rhodohalobacter sp. 8-1]|uniref:T9SS type A sorting domain-containing protein n=1 Tax=Rhodohalobacter sp. 8-1 TaxID=3131972 RepID=UPI0030EE01E9
MKNTVTFILFLLCLIGLVIQPLTQNRLTAQITLDQSSFTQLLNTTTEVTATSYSDPDPVISIIDQTGEDETWDLTVFANADSIVSTGSIEFFNSFDGKLGADFDHFSDANVMAQAEFETSFEVNGVIFEVNQIIYSYNSLTENGLVEHGTISADAASPNTAEITVRNTPAQPLFPFPLTYNTMWNYSYTSEVTQSGSTPFSTDYSVNAVVDGYGQVLIGDESIPVLRITETETSEISGFEFTTVNVSFINENGFEVASASVDIDVFSQNDDYERASANIQLTLFDELTTVSSESSPDIPETVKLNQNYPNPFNPTTQISYQLDSPAEVSLTVYSLTGQEVQTLLNNEFKQAGEYSVPFDAGDLASGIYMYRLRAGDQMFTRKMTLLK